MTDYNYDKFSALHYALDNFGGPQPGQKTPDFAEQTTDGSLHNQLDFEGEFLVLEIGSITCPLFQSRRGVMKALSETYLNASFAILYVREAHPGDSRPQHKIRRASWPTPARCNPGITRAAIS
ncbi:MAG: deiodinase-like protein [Paracoccaceae bacterium]